MLSRRQIDEYGRVCCRERLFGTARVGATPCAPPVMTRFITLGLLASVGAYLQPAPGRLRAAGRKHRCNGAQAAANEPQQHAVDAPAQNRAPAITALAAASLVTAGPAFAADALPSAIAAYSHYLALMGIVGSLTTCLTVRGTQTLVSLRH